ncbi:MAG TPA: hypothetical protein VIY53_09760 [Acidobacteriaceae bacterium]
MRALSNSDFLQLWERGCGMHPIDQALLALGAALPHLSRASLADWPLGRRNAALAELRRRCFGAELRSWVACPQCDERLEFQLDADALAKDGGEEPAPRTVIVRERKFRLPTSRDLAAVVAEPDADRASVRLLERCCESPADGAAWSEADAEEVEEQLALADPLAETRLALRCSACSHEWEESLDLASYLWSEIEARARRTLIDVHTLASAYGWSEEQILALSEPRRAVYLEMVQA